MNSEIQNYRRFFSIFFGPVLHSPEVLQNFARSDIVATVLLLEDNPATWVSSLNNIQ
jgi:hypothetical protein